MSLVVERDVQFRRGQFQPLPLVTTLCQGPMNRAESEKWDRALLSVFLLLCFSHLSARLPKASVVLCGIIYLFVTVERFCVLGNVTRASISWVEIGWTRNFKWTILLRLLCFAPVNGAVAASVWKTTNKTAEPPIHHHLSEGELYKSQLKPLTSHLFQFSLNAAKDLNGCPPPVFSHRICRRSQVHRQRWGRVSESCTAASKCQGRSCKSQAISLWKHYIDWIPPTSSFEVLKSMCYYAVRDTAEERNKVIKLRLRRQMLNDTTTRRNETMLLIPNKHW